VSALLNYNLKISKGTLILIIIVGAVTGGNIWLHRNDTPLLVSYSEYDFTFTHRGGGYVFTGEDRHRTLSYMDGSYGVNFLDGGFLEDGIYWFSVEKVAVSGDESILEASLNMKFEDWRSIGIPFSREDDFFTSERDGQDMIYAFFKSYKIGHGVHGIMSAWQDDDRIFIFYTIYSDDVENSQRDTPMLTAVWRQQLSHLTCN
jgi:hypothetical protein